MGLSGALVATVLAGAGCSTKQSDAAENDVLAQREARLARALAHPDSGSGPAELARWLLPEGLTEISGLALTSDGRLLAHGDEHGTVWEVDYRRGAVVKEFKLGKESVKGDFEGITVANDVIFLFTSTGKLYEFREGANGARVDYAVHDTRLESVCEFEGVAFAPSINSLLLACKDVKDKSLKDSLVIYRWKLQSADGEGLSRLTVPLRRVIGSNPWKGLHPSDITVDPFTGNYVLVASKEKALIEISPAGVVVSAGLLPGEHLQAEGVAITKDSLLIVSDEAARDSPPLGHRPEAVISVYRWPRGAVR